jgi:hypothetical protein
MQQNQNASATQSTTTIAEKTAIVAGAALFFATPVLIFIRRKPGYRFLNPIQILVMFFLLDLLSGATEATGTTAAFAITLIFAWAVLIIGMLKRRARWQEIKQGVSWHTRSRGVSWLTGLLPFSDSMIKRWFDPLAILAIGLLFLLFDKYLGYYLIFAAFCLFLFEAWDYEQSLNKMLDTLDSLVDSEVMSENVEYYSQPHVQQRALTETAGIPTGIAPDIQHQIEKRRTGRALPPDNLVVVATSNNTGTLPGAVI